MNKIVEVSNLKKSYGKIEAVKGIDFYVEQGKLFAFLGPNGAGKSTTIDIICTLLQKDSGEVKINGNVLGHDDDKIRNSIGVVFQDNLLDPLLTVYENISIRAGFYNMTDSARKDAIKNAIRVSEVSDFVKRPYGKLSGGQRRRADIARALVNNPKILFLDEPTTGLDPQTRQSVWKTISELQRNEGMTVFLTTHYMEEASNADYVVIIDGGLISAKGAPYELKEKYCTDWLKVRASNPEEYMQIIKNSGYEAKMENGILLTGLRHTKDALPIIEKTSQLIESFEVVKGTMDDVFINVTGKEMREDA